ncbi:TetR/AcrR family transcriptional regulator [Mucilaginibacter lappiensis]|uniref:AcrR family transcriptional regulator n=1 Tax=Mucilaginibacter lappiensis TaxID=354630 RepID=A0A1N7AUL9_9SPHI|nr:TetR/AcrR family transcriptional regulator [Mucilaginibacter lappiensis]MBB6110603.1 AcrR family transcriptional regulator [Mucilaginibacter lappiensis]MBB6131752.1 AcrR family transcriptional regulator [Mucilaginibacter lappiensis]SIR42764.1 transcriptional regulator, TetR family [Mucilaginibacter lappiensis]
MGKLSLDKGRVSQKMKTREVLLLKANELLKQRIEISVDLVAREAGISKATAYRYFSSSEALKREASLQLKAKTNDNLFADLSINDLKGRLDRLIDYHFNLFINNEVEFRLFLSSIIGESVIRKETPSRAGRRIILIREALKPLQSTLTSGVFDHMVNSLSIFFGIESITVLKDVCRLTNDEILQTWKWSVNRIVFFKD